MPEFFLYCIYDLKAKQPHNSIFQILPSDAVAARVFTDILTLPGPDGRPSDLSLHPDDYVMVRVGVVNYDTLSIASYDVGASDPVITGSAVMRSLKHSESPTMSEANDASSGEPELALVADLSSTN